MRKVLVVDDSPVIVRVLRDLLEAEGTLHVTHVARDGIEALEILKQADVDVVTLDVHMPKLDGLGTLKEVIRLHRLPCVMVSSLTQAGAQVTLDALEAGAVDFFAKPEGDSPGAIMEQAELLRAKVRAAADCDLEKIFRKRPELVQPSFARTPSRDLILMGASTGGPRALATILSCFPADVPAAFVVAQHMPGGYTSELATRLDSSSRLTVREGRHGERLQPGCVYVAPGGKLTRIRAREGGMELEVLPPLAGQRFKPSVDALFCAAAEIAGRRTIACLLTGMGDDGTVGIKRLCQAGAVTLAESERSSVVFGMPASAIATGAVLEVVSKELMAEEILHQMTL